VPALERRHIPQTRKVIRMSKTKSKNKVASVTITSRFWKPREIKVTDITELVDMGVKNACLVRDRNTGELGNVDLPVAEVQAMLDVANAKPKSKLRVWWIPQVPMRAFRVDVDSVDEGVKLMTVLADYDAFQYDNNIKPDYSNIGGLEMFDTQDTTDSPEGSWCNWYDDETDEDDPYEFVRLKLEKEKEQA